MVSNTEGTNYHRVDSILFLEVDALEEDALPILDLLPHWVFLEEVNYVELGRLPVWAVVGHIVSHQEDHHLLYHERISILVALSCQIDTASRN